MRATRLVIAVLAVSLVTGASAGAAAGIPAKKKPKTTTTAKASTSVDLTVSGATPITIKGTKVDCQIGSSGYSAVYVDGSNYPSLGAGNFVALSISNSVPLLKAVIGGAGFISGNVPASSLTASGKTLTANGITANGSTGPITVTGTVKCG